MELISQGNLIDHVLPYENYRFLRAVDLNKYLNSIKWVSLSYQLFEEFRYDKKPSFVKNINVCHLGRGEINMLCPQDFLEVTITLTNGRTQKLQYVGYYATELIKVITHPVPTPVISESRQFIISNSNSYKFYNTSWKRIYWPD